MSIPITNGTGQSSVAAEAVGGLQYQQIEVYGRGAASVLGINPDGSINASVIGTPNVNVAGSIIAVSQSSSTIAVVTGSVVALQGTTPWVGVASVYGSGSVVAFQGTSPWVMVGSVYGSGSVAAFQAGTVITSVVSTVPSSVLVGASIFGALPAGNAVLGAVAASISGTVAVTGTVTATITGTPSISGAVFVSGSVLAQQTGTVITSIVSSIPSSVLVGASIFGQLPAGTAPLGSVATLQGTNPWIVVNVGSIISINTGSIITTQIGSVITVPIGSTIAVLQSPSIVGTYAEDATFTQNDKGLFMLGVRNDTMASVTSADLDYSQIAVGPVGENIVANAPITKWVQGVADLRGLGSTGVSVIAIATGGSSIFTYITGVQVANMGSASVLVTLASGGSTLGYTIAPAGGGSNIVYRNALKTPANFGFAASISGAASVLVSAQGFVSKV